MTKDEKLAKLQRSFEDWSLALDTSHRAGRTILSTKSMGRIMKELGKLVQVLREDE